MSKKISCFISVVAVSVVLGTGLVLVSQANGPQTVPIAGTNVNMVSGITLPGGDPWLQRQNEPSLAVSTRNPLHLLAGANDYRTVDIPIPDEQLPGLNRWIAAGDAWLGIFKSLDGGQSWFSTLLPGFTQDVSDEGFASPLKGLQAAADPTVRAGANGLFYLNGIAFDRIKNGRSVVFVSRYIDNNNLESGDPIAYIDTRVIDEGTSGQFADKPWIAVDAPRNGGTVSIDGQFIPQHTVYLVYSIFVGDLAQNVHNKIMCVRSLDCGNTWENPVKISESQHVNQGTSLAIAPSDGTIYVVWRRFASDSESDAILLAKSTDFGKKFSKAKVVTEFIPFDQGTTEYSFRTSSFPTIAVDYAGTVYLAWSQRNGNGEARIMMTTSANKGGSWSDPQAVDDAANGHQFMPSLSASAGNVVVAWYDSRRDAAGQPCGFGTNYLYLADDPLEGCSVRHTIDVRVATSEAGASPQFLSTQVSRYLWALDIDQYGNYSAYQAQYNPPNYPLFQSGTVPFHGDYIDLSPSPRFLKAGGVWRFNGLPLDPPNLHVAWTDNRDVRPPYDNNWTLYTPPEPGCPDGERTGMRNQNVYTSQITQGIALGSPGNTKPLGDIQRAYVILIKNLTDQMRHFRCTIDAPPGVPASFFQDMDPEDPLYDQLDLSVSPFSSLARSVFIESSQDDVTVTVHVQEIDALGGSVIEGGLEGFITLNPDDSNPIIQDPVGANPNNPSIIAAETHFPNIENPNIENWTVANPNIVNPNIVNPNIENPNIVNPNIVNPNIVNPNIVNPNIENPNIENPNIVNPNIVNPNIVNPSIAGSEMVDVTWRVFNEGNTTSSYTFKMITGDSPPSGTATQLFIYKVHYTPGSQGCDLIEDPYHELVVNITNPYFIDPGTGTPNIENPNIENPNIENATFFLAPGEEALVTLRLVESGLTSAGSMSLQQEAEDLMDFADSLGAAVIAHAVNTDGVIHPWDATMKIITGDLPDGIEAVPYTAQLELFGGSGPYSWLVTEGSLPPGLTLDQSTGGIAGTPSLWGEYSFTVEVTDTSEEVQLDSVELLIRIAQPLAGVGTGLDDAVQGQDFTQAIVSGGIEPYVAQVTSGALPADLDITESGQITGIPQSSGTFSFSVEIQDSATPAQTLDLDLELDVHAPLEPQTAQLDDGVNGAAYLETLEAQGGLAPFTWSLVSGTLPPGVLLTANGTLEGAATGAGTFTFEAQVTDSASPAQTTSLQLSIRIFEPLAVSTTSLPDATVEIPYSAALAAEQGQPPYTWIITSGGLPPGLVLDQGVISGAPTASGLYQVTVQVTDAAVPPQSEAQSLSLLVKEPVQITTTSLPDGAAGLAYDAGLTASGGTESYVWSLEVGGLPPGLTLDPGGRIAGSPAAGGSFVFTVRAADAGNPGLFDTQGLTIQVYALSILTVSLDPDEVTVGTPYAAELQASGGFEPYTWSLAEGSGLPSGLEIQGNTITGVPAADPGVYPFTVRVEDSFVPPQEREQQFSITLLPKTQVDLVWGGGPDNAEAGAVEVDETGNVFVTGFIDPLTASTDIFLVKYDSDLNKLWQVTYDGPEHLDDAATAVAVGDSGILVGGYSTDEQSGKDILILKYSHDGILLWEARYDGPAHFGDVPTAIALDASENVLVTGYVHRGMTTAHADYCTLKFSPEGKLIWDETYDARRNGNDEALAIAVDAAGDVYITGKSQESQEDDEVASHDYLTVKYSAKGKMIWEARDEGSGLGDEVATAIALDGFGNVYVSGTSTGSGVAHDFYTIKYNAEGEVVWKRTFGGTGDDVPMDMIVDTEGNVYLTGYTHNGSDTDYAMLKYAPDGSPAWSADHPDGAVRYDGGLNDEARAITMDDSGYLYVTGFSTSESTGADFLTLCYDPGALKIWEARFDGPAHKDDVALALALGPQGNLFVSGFSFTTETKKDFVTLKYD